MIIVSLTTIPPRFKYLYLTINSILNQNVKPDKIIINIPKKYNNFIYNELPSFDNSNIIINNDTLDYGPATKLVGLYHTNIYKNMDNNDIIIIIDDDRIYNKYFIQSLLIFHNKYNNKVLTIAGWDIDKLTNNKLTINNTKFPRGIEFIKPGFVNILGGCCGFLLTKEQCPFNNYYNEFKDLNPNDDKYYVDDIVISGLLTVNNIEIYSVPNMIHKDEQRHFNDTIYELNDTSRINKNINAINYFKNKYNIWI